MRSLAFALVFVGLACGGHVPISYCGTMSRARIEHVDIEQCDSESCVIRRGRWTRFMFAIDPYVNSTTLTLDASLTLVGMSSPVTALGSSNLCGYIRCPILAGRTYDDAAQIMIGTWVPRSRAMLTYRINGDDGELGCFATNVKIAY
ncbi:mite group 2 allergen-like Ixo r 2 [Ornithodoros turicata]|uniref:mite group 2 allergen-like Ixo r 2 n=1 Tax=Ornithodoros turicata TaxID=34597 RepID=UPI0031398175